MAVAFTQVTIRRFRSDDVTLTRTGGEVHLHIGQVRIKCASPGHRLVDIGSLRDEAAAMRRLAEAAGEAAQVLDARATELEATRDGDAA
jgi:uncharacterized protein (DUF111 family)